MGQIGHSSLGERLKFEPAKFRRRRSFYGRIILNAATSISEHDEALRNIDDLNGRARPPVVLQIRVSGMS